MANHQNGFGTNLTSGVSAGATTSPLDSIPTIDAPFYLAFDATNVNSHFEIVYVTSKTATNVNHAALTYDHTTAEEVRLVFTAGEMDAINQPIRGYMKNGKIVPSVGSNNLTVALKTLAGTDPSITDPVIIRIGDTVREITSALSRTFNAGTNYLNLGSSELATKETDLFPKLVWNTNLSAVDLIISRIPFGDLISEYTDSLTGEKGYLYSGTKPASTDICENIGRFAATLSGGAGYTWTVPTYTVINLIQRPIFETRWLNWVGTVTSEGGAPTTFPLSPSIYRVSQDGVVEMEFKLTVTNKGTATGKVMITTPFSLVGDSSGCCVDQITTGKQCSIANNTTKIELRLYDATTPWIASAAWQGFIKTRI